MLNVGLVGFGKIAQSYRNDKVMARQLKYVSHLQVIDDHPQLRLVAVAEPDSSNRAEARSVCAGSVDVSDDASNLKNREAVDLVVLACPPQSRLAALQAFPNAKAVIVEKPLGNSLSEASEFSQECSRRGLKVQVNLTRRADRTTRLLASSLLSERVGDIQAIFGVYGNGANNNATHMVDLIRMLVGEVAEVQAFPDGEFVEGPLLNDANFPFSLILASNVVAHFSPVLFKNYRENGLEIWGSRGRLDYWHGGLTVSISAVAPNRGMENAFEIASDRPEHIKHTLGTALYEIYDNLIESLGGAPLWSSLDSALQTTAVIDCLFRSKNSGNRLAVPAFELVAP